MGCGLDIGHRTARGVAGPGPDCRPSEADRGHRGRRGTEHVSTPAQCLALRLLNFHKDGAVFEDPHITGGFRDDNGNSLGHRGNASRRHVA